MKSKVKKMKEWAFFAGSIVGFAQVMLGTAVGVRFGPVLGILASCATYFFGEKFYQWFTQADEESSDE